MKRALLIASLILAGLGAGPAYSADKIKVISSLKGFWDTTLVEYGREKGIFADEGLDVEVVFVKGGGDVLQTVIAGGGDIGVGTGTAGALAAVTKGAPLVIVGAEFTGASDVFFYAKGSSDIKSFKDLDGKKLGISHPGSTTTTIASLLAKSEGVNIEHVVTGGPPATITQVMTDQVDAGWSVYPIGLDKVDSGELRIIASGNDAPNMASQNARVSVASKDFAENHTDLLKRFYRAYGKVLDWAYSTDEALQKYGDAHQISLEKARETVQTAYPRQAVEPGTIASLDVTMHAAVANKALDRALTDEELSEILRTVKIANE